MKEKMNEEIIANEHNKNIINGLKEEVKKLKESNPNSSHLNDHTEELKKLKEMMEKAKELKNTSDLKIKKLKELHLEEINEVKIQNLKLQGELSNVVKESQRLKESERILVQTFDTLKVYYEKPQNIVECSQCGISCANESELRKHKQDNHTQVFACISCSFVSESRGDLETHALPHIPSTERTMFQCEVCGLEGFNKDVMEKHIEKSHTCVECNTLHKDLYDLNRHKEKHHQSKTFRCKECDFNSNTEENLKNHIIRHKRVAYSCEVCGKSGKSQDEIDEHIQTVHVKEMYENFLKSNGTRSEYRAADTAREYSHEERKNNGFCFHWNRGRCSFGDFCLFSHEESPACRFQENCYRKETCKFFHEEHINNIRSSFLSQRPGRTSQF